jgi:hypothetical protein
VLKWITRLCCAAAFAVTAQLVLAGTAVAAGVNIDRTECVSYIQYYDNSEHLFTVCDRVQGVEQQTQTPSGNTIAVYNTVLTKTLSIDGAQPEIISTADGRSMILVKNGVYQVVQVDTTQDFFTQGLHCTSTDRFHIANGQLQFSNTSFACV